MLTGKQAFQMSYNIHVSEEFGFIFFNNPKAGCSTTKATLNLACAKRLGVRLEYRQMHDVHTRAHNILKTPRQIGARQFERMVADPKVVRFCFLREPVSRVASAYASKFRGNSPQRQRLNEFLKRPADYSWPDINEFASALASDDAVRDLDPLWRLQYRQVCAGDVAHTFVGFQEDLEAGLRKVAGMVFGDDVLDIFDVREHFRHNVSKSEMQKQLLTPDSLRSIRQAYAADFEFYAREKARTHSAAA
jgi:hypothetical protein